MQCHSFSSVLSLLCSVSLRIVQPVNTMKWAVIFVVQYNKNVVKSFSEDRQKWIATPTICNKDKVITVYFKDVFLNACIGYAFESKQTDNIVIHRPVFVKFAFNLFFFYAFYCEIREYSIWFQHGRLKVKTTEEQQQAKQAERAKKLQLYNAATSRAFQKVCI